MRISAFRAENSASSWYRCYMWMDAMRKFGHKVLFDSQDVKNWQTEDIDKFVKGADIVISGRTNQPMFYAAMQAGRDLYGYKLILDTDDLVDSVHRFHPASYVYHGATGMARLSHAQYRDTDAMTVSTKRLYEHTLPYNSSTFLVPNCAEPVAWETVRKRHKEDRHRGDIRIYWGGGGGHYGDLLLVKSALLRLVKEDSRVKLIFQNFIPDWAANLPASQSFYVPFVEFNGYYKLLTWLCADIAIAPLENNEHNLCKSDVKYLDYAMAKIPGVYQRIEPYETVNDGVTGLMADNDDEWYDALKRLIDNPILRQNISEAAEHDVRAHRSIASHSARYEAMLNEVLNSKKRETPELSFLTEGVPVEIVNV